MIYFSSFRRGEDAPFSSPLFVRAEGGEEEEKKEEEGLTDARSQETGLSGQRRNAEQIVFLFFSFFLDTPEGTETEQRGFFF